MKCARYTVRDVARMAGISHGTTERLDRDTAIYVYALTVCSLRLTIYNGSDHRYTLQRLSQILGGNFEKIDACYQVYQTRCKWHPDRETTRRMIGDAIAATTRTLPAWRAIRTLDRLYQIDKMVIAHPWCSYCGSSEDLTIDHIVPTSAMRRDPNDPFSWPWKEANLESNLAVACRRCNSRKGAKTAEQYLSWIQKQ